MTRKHTGKGPDSLVTPFIDCCDGGYSVNSLHCIICSQAGKFNFTRGSRTSGITNNTFLKKIFYAVVFVE